MNRKTIKSSRNLTSISLLPPPRSHSKTKPNKMRSVVSEYQLRSTQGISSQLSQLMPTTSSQDSLDDDILNIELVPDTQVRENRRPVSNNYQDSEELEHKIKQMETTQNRHGMILESIQSDIIQVKKQMQEYTLNVESIKQKLAGQDNSLQLVLKGEEDIRTTLVSSVEGIKQQLAGHDNSLQLVGEEEMKNTFVSSVEGIKQKLADHDNSLQLVVKGEEDMKITLDERLNSLPDQLRKEVHQEIVSAILTLQNQNEQQMLKLTTELSGAFANSVKAITNFLQPSDNKERDCHPTQSQNVEPAMNSAVLPQKVYTRSKRKLKTNAETGQSSKQKPDSFANTRRSKINTPEEILLIDLDKEWRENNEFDEELDGGFAYLLTEKETGGSNFYDEDQVEAQQILKKARRNRKHSNVN
ncbi:hypothetical protein MKW94_010658 [Papaver nudicaule]|uniref:Uncharacterized protein n=1 Tax=Papaver nudicaule TaxID=74823 RepID=A0AA41VWP1_PAPNU|nr:hypothetical protein [Papaver nudicaule]